MIRVLTCLIMLALATPAAAHHVGSWTPRDNEVSANFKQVKFAVQARKFDVALRLYETGALRRQLKARAAELPPGLDESIRTALAQGNAVSAERGLTIFFLDLVLGLAREAERQAGDRGVPAATRAAGGRKFLEAIWRYYNLIDFAVAQQAPKAAAGIRLAVDEAEAYAKDGAAPADVDRLPGSFRAIANLASDVIQTPSPTARRQS